jgi:hypothetical protein
VSATPCGGLPRRPGTSGRCSLGRSDLARLRRACSAASGGPTIATTRVVMGRPPTRSMPERERPRDPGTTPPRFHPRPRRIREPPAGHRERHRHTMVAASVDRCQPPPATRSPRPRTPRSPIPGDAFRRQTPSPGSPAPERVRPACAASRASTGTSSITRARRPRPHRRVPLPNTSMSPTAPQLLRPTITSVRPPCEPSRREPVREGFRLIDDRDADPVRPPRDGTLPTTVPTLAENPSCWNRRTATPSSISMGRRARSDAPCDPGRRTRARPSARPRRDLPATPRSSPTSAGRHANSIRSAPDHRDRRGCRRLDWWHPWPAVGRVAIHRTPARLASPGAPWNGAE